MLLSETAKILAKIQLLDNRTVDRTIVEAWHEAIGRFEFADAMAALTLHRQESTEYVLPAHIKSNITRAKAIRNRDEARQRAIETARICRLIESTGSVPTPANIEAMREVTANTEPADRLELVAEIIDEPEQPKNDLYQRLINSPEGRESIMRGNFLKSA